MTIMPMFEEGPGMSILPELVLGRCSYTIITKSILPPVVRKICMLYKDNRVLSIVSKYFL